MRKQMQDIESRQEAWGRFIADQHCPRGMRIRLFEAFEAGWAAAEEHRQADARAEKKWLKDIRAWQRDKNRREAEES